MMLCVNLLEFSQHSYFFNSLFSRHLKIISIGYVFFKLHTLFTHVIRLYSTIPSIISRYALLIMYIVKKWPRYDSYFVV